MIKFGIRILALLLLVGGVLGVAIALYMGYGMVRHRKAEPDKEEYLPHHPFIVGLITSLSNPYFFLWWATIGLLLISTASGFGAWAVVAFALVHWSCDLVWDWFVSFMTFKSRKFWTGNTQAWVLGACGLVLIFFGVYFIVSPLLS